MMQELELYSTAVKSDTLGVEPQFNIIKLMSGRARIWTGLIPWLKRKRQVVLQR